jgi:hypothetical protein
MSMGSGDLLLLCMGVAPSGRVRGVWGLGGVLELVREGCHEQAPRCNSLEVSRRCMIPHRMVVWHVFPRRVEAWWGIL